MPSNPASSPSPAPIAPSRARDGNRPAGSLNLALVVGTLSSDPRARLLPSGSTLVQLEMTTAGSPAESVPVVMFDGPTSIDSLRAGDEVVVLGRVRRRFFRAGTVSQSRTEVVADRIVKSARRRSVAPVVSTARERLDEIDSRLTG
ncbi:MAG: single-stranded DNA-binding protein [Acidimicrobiia bacterium]|nr:single-stranded DNA-binding protein [Acidimicrobiia bacterium]